MPSFPGPLPNLRSRLRVAATSSDTYAAIGAMGLPIFVAVRLGTMENGPQIEAYRAAFRAAGHAGQGEVYLRVPIYVGDLAATRRHAPIPRIPSFHSIERLGCNSSARPRLAVLAASERRAERGQALQAIFIPDVLRDKVIVGTPTPW